MNASSNETAEAEGDTRAYDVFLSYATADRSKVAPLVQALRDAGLSVFLDDGGIDTHEGITPTIRTALRRTRLVLLYYSRTYLTRPACQWELMTAFRAASALGDPSRRMLVINPEPKPAHIAPVELADPLYAVPDATGSYTQLIGRVTSRLDAVPQALGDAINETAPTWWPNTASGSPDFVGRVPDMWTIHSALHAHRYPLTAGNAGPPVAYLSGMGGQGKTLLAQTYARRFAAFYPGGIIWTTAYASHEPDTTDETAVLAENHRQLDVIARRMNISTGERERRGPRAAILARIIHTGQPCLWIIDDLPARLSQDARAEMIPNHELAHTLITTRYRRYNDAHRIDLDPLTPHESYQLLTGIRTLAPQEQKDARTLTEELGHHALAVDLARGSTSDALTTYASLSTALKETETDAFQTLVDELGDDLPTTTDRNIATMLHRSIRHFSDTSPTMELLRLAAILSPAPIPRTLITETLTATPQPLLDTTIAAAIRAANDRSLIRHASPDPDTWSVHALISRTITMYHLPPQHRHNLQQAAVQALNTHLTDAAEVLRHRELTPYLPHSRALTTTPTSTEELELTGWVARFDYEAGQYASANHLFAVQAAASIRSPGPDHPSTATCLSNLAATHLALGQAALALPLQERALAITETVLGPDHPTTAISLGNLAGTHLALGQAALALPLQERALAITETVLGPDHPTTAIRLGNLAATHLALGQAALALPLQERALAITETVLGPDHPDTAIRLSNLAATHSALGQAALALPLQERALAITETVLGPDHPTTAIRLSNLAATHRALGQAALALPLQERALAITETVLGPDHPTTAIRLGNLAATHRDLGDNQSALSAAERARVIASHALGSSHPLSIALDSLVQSITDNEQ
ncbi:tetratricopeptide repeat protein [Streptacidiphilus sp. PAMC 29251]